MTRTRINHFIRHSILLVLSVLTLSHSASADSETLYRNLVKDIVFECDHFDELQNSFDRKKVEEFKLKWLKFISDPKQYPRPPLQLKLAANRVLTLRDDSQSKVSNVTKYSELTALEEMTLPQKLSGKASSIKDVKLYISNRIGPNTIETISNSSLNVEVVGGESTLQGEWRRIPSFYEKWGIEKFLVTNGEKNTLIFKVPPAKEFVQHYLGMLDAAGVHTARGFINNVSRNKLKLELESSAKALLDKGKSMGDRPWVTLGYSSALEKEIQEGARAGLVQGLKVTSEKVGHVGAKILSFKVDGKPKMMIALYSDLTLWGEGSSFLVRGALDSGVSGVVFMGSAGNLSRKYGVYDYSAPTQFLDEQFREIPIDNFLASQDIKTVHAATYSPIEETIEHVDYLLEKNVDTIDVEVIRIAEAVAEYQKKPSSQKIVFGVLNLVTDLPVSTRFSEHVEFNLDQISVEKKTNSKLLVARKFFKEWISLPNHLPCDGYLYSLKVK